MAQDAIELITQDHRELEAVFEQLRSGSGDAVELREQMATMFIAHARAEEREVYPTIAKQAPDAKGEVHHGKEEHEEAEELLEQLLSQDVDSKQFRSTLEEFVEAVNHHVEEEESEILPALRKAVGARRLEELGAAFARVREQVAAERESGVEASRSESETDLTRDELYQKAKESGVEGRSSMTKEELARAVADPD